MGATVVTISSNRVASVAALDAAIAAFEGAGENFISPPTVVGYNKIALSASALPTPNAYTGCHFLAVENDDWRLDTPTVAAQFNGLAAGEGSRWSTQTVLGYNLHMIGQAFGGGLNMGFTDPAATQTATGTIPFATAGTSTSGTDSLAGLLDPFPSADGYEYTILQAQIDVTQASTFIANQSILGSYVSIYNSGIALSYPAWATSYIPLRSGQGSQTIAAFYVPVQTDSTGNTEVTVEFFFTVEQAAAVSDIVFTVTLTNAFYGLRTRTT